MGRPTARLGGRCSLVATAVVAAMAAVLAVCLVPAAVDGRRTITATGRFLCSMPGGGTKPIAGSSIRLMNKNAHVAIDQKMALGATAADGSFRLRGRGGDFAIGKGRRPDPYVRLTYTSVGSDHSLDVDISRGILRALGNYRGDKTPTMRNKKHSANYGTVTIKTLECQAYVRFREAMIEFKARTGRNTPGGFLRVRTRVTFHGGTEYTLYDAIKLPRKSTVTRTMATHELAHVARHVLDGSQSHFARDVLKYGYARRHSCDSRTNLGYAFNEGWAEYWAGECVGDTVEPLDDYKVEGNVATALRSLQSRCSTTDGKMVQVLERSPLNVHSFQDFRKRHKDLYKCE